MVACPCWFVPIVNHHLQAGQTAEKICREKSVDFMAKTQKEGERDKDPTILLKDTSN